jgi:hypothetical protein
MIAAMTKAPAMATRPAQPGRGPDRQRPVERGQEQRGKNHDAGTVAEQARRRPLATSRPQATEVGDAADHQRRDDRGRDAHDEVACPAQHHHERRDGRHRESRGRRRVTHVAPVDEPVVGGECQRRGDGERARRDDAGSHPEHLGAEGSDHRADRDAEGSVHQRQRNIGERVHLGADAQRRPRAFGVERVAAAPTGRPVIHGALSSHPASPGSAPRHAVLLPARP